MSKIAYREIPSALANYEKFEGASMNAMWVEEYDGSVSYRVWSYRTLMLVIKDGAVIYHDTTFYSNTTSHHQGIIARFVATHQFRQLLNA